MCALNFLDLNWTTLNLLSCLHQIRVVQWNLWYSKEKIYSNCLYSLNFFMWNNNSNVLQTYWKLQLTFLNIGLYSPFKDSWIHQNFHQMNYYWATQKIRGATIHQRKNLHRVISHIVIFSLIAVLHLYLIYEFDQQ